MLDIKFIKENSEVIKEAVRKKRLTVDIDRLLTLDNERLELLSQVEALRAKQNEASVQIQQAQGDERETLISAMKEVKEELQAGEEKLKGIMTEWRSIMLQVPNVPDMSVPEGDDDSQNEETRVWGDLPKFDFEPKNHIELLEKLGLIDFERGAKVSGFRGYILKGEAVKLHFALWQWAMDELNKKGFESMIVPTIVRPEPFFGTGYLPQGEEDLYKTQDGDYLAGTAEVATMGYYLDEVLEGELPKKMAAFSPCFRREAGSHGKDTKGAFRVHEFYKVEQVVLCEASHEESVKWHEELTKNAEELMQALKIPYHVVTNCTGDLGLGQVKKYDIEAWLPSEGKYRETHSISYFHDFQTRRLNIRYRDAEGKLRFAHSLNGTAAATPRLFIALVENYQNADGTITVPEVLRPYFGHDQIK
ncbi:MAG: serine--tRNA ligase [Candidatus Pacebacteria bacterium]|nr:serine--tRNA ligase [Candidatus Paceibacterota bacterium]